MNARFAVLAAMLAIVDPVLAQVATNPPVTAEKPIYLSCVGSTLQYGKGFGPPFTAELKGTRHVIVVDKARGIISADTALAGHVDASMYENDEQWYAAAQRVNVPYKGKVIRFVVVEVNRINGQGQVSYSVDPRATTGYLDFGGRCSPAVPQF